MYISGAKSLRQSVKPSDKKGSINHVESLHFRSLSKRSCSHRDLREQAYLCEDARGVSDLADNNQD